MLSTRKSQADPLANHSLVTPQYEEAGAPGCSRMPPVTNPTHLARREEPPLGTYTDPATADDIGPTLREEGHALSQAETTNNGGERDVTSRPGPAPRPRPPRPRKQTRTRGRLELEPGGQMRVGQTTPAIRTSQTVVGLAEQASTEPEHNRGAWRRRTHTSPLARRAIGTPPVKHRFSESILSLLRANGWESAAGIKTKNDVENSRIGVYCDRG